MHQHFTITLPLNLGLEALKTNSDHLTQQISTSECQIAISIPSNILLSLTHRLSNNIAHLRATQKNWSNNLLQLNLIQTVEQKGQIAIALNQQSTTKYELFPFRINFNLNKQIFHVTINKLALEVTFIHIPKAKFVKNQILQNVIKQHQDDSWGLITMDQAQRIVLQPQNSNFPAIGIWVSQKQLTGMRNIQKIVNYFCLKLQKKCRFISDGKKYIYIAHIPVTNKTPQLYLSYWNTPQQVLTQLDFPIKEINKQNQLILRSDQHSHLEFTLRSDQKIPTKLQNIQCSPIVFEEQSETSLQVPLPDSPRFSQAHKGLEVQCATLRRLVKMQHQEIVRLKKQLLRLSSSSGNKQHDYNSAKTRSSPIKKAKLLTEKDLSLGSTPRSDPTTLSSSDPLDEWNPWQHFQIVQK